MRLLEFTVAALLAAPVLALAEDPPARQNYFNDPFQQITDGLPACPTPPGPEITEAEMRAEAHGRSERGGSCYRDGRCRLPNAYLYDREIIPRVKIAVDADGRFAKTTRFWALGQRRWVTLRGCVSTATEAVELERLVKGLDDVEAVVNQLTVRPPSAN
ncbi:BON domain-containing protein [Paucibacter sp. R3-3]|uniref:BON domain-containing protein n=1 Tax=Roseateles agri TaxID=3098619 RepID=A0ABU5DHZ6_9BURK|nr:BON domain-containing protein [Paucibacter sp. R3-3]MDY0744839.1 BON domain-containing protein [Paucibacter sp. R3-3]